MRIQLENAMAVAFINHTFLGRTAHSGLVLHPHCRSEKVAGRLFNLSSSGVLCHRWEMPDVDLLASRF